MFSRFRIKRWVQFFLMGFVLFFAIGFVEKKHSGKICSRIQVQIEDNLGNYFINENDIIGLVTSNGNEPLIGRAFRNIDLKNLELRVKTNKFIRNCQVSRNLKGDLLVEVQQNVPIARVVQADAPDAYISHTGQVLPLSERYTARVLLIQGEYTRKLLSLDFSSSEEGKPFFELLQAIDQDPFWKAQIAELYVDRSGEITIFPQVGRQVIEFGAPTDMKAKFQKLKMFYKQILPAKGWNRYAKVSVKYRNQIICE